MKYEAIVEGSQIRDAFETLRSALERTGTHATTHFKEDGFHHPDQEIWSSFGERESHYFIGFGPAGEDTPLFEANPPREGANATHGKGLFVVDDGGRRHLVRTGYFRVPEDHPFSKEPSDAFREFTEDKNWINIDRKGPRFLIVSIDESPSDIISRIKQVIDIIDEFKFGQDISGGRRDHQKPDQRSTPATLNQILFGPPGTGKTYETVSAAFEVLYGRPPRDRAEAKDHFGALREAGRVEFVTFHQSYAYEDFIEGIRPKLEGDELRYVLRDGIFKRIAQRASQNPGKLYALIIDEINRGNIAKIFGELITLIEPSKRKGGEDAAEAMLPYSQKWFSVPDNLYLIGTMNTADRGIALLDTALRRRFKFVERMSDTTHLAEDVEGVNCRRLLESINGRIVELLDRDHQIGHTYLMGVRTLEDLADAFRDQIVPLLQEYFYDDWEKLRRVLNDNGFIESRKGKIVRDKDVFEALAADDERWQRAASYQAIYGGDDDGA